MKMTEVKKGDVISASRFLYRHYGIYTGNGRVIHYSSVGGDFGNDACVRETSLKQFARGGTCRVVDFTANINRTKTYSREDTVRRARSRIGDKRYNVIFNNCEHFVYWCKTGKNKSTQVAKTIGTVAFLGAAVIFTGLLVDSNKKGKL